MLKKCKVPCCYVNDSKKRRRLALLNDREYEFLIYCASDKSYKQIANEMGVAYRTLDCHRNAVFKKLNIASRAGLAIYAILNGLNDFIDNSSYLILITLLVLK